MFRGLSLLLLMIYFFGLIYILRKEKKSESVQDYFFGGRQLSFLSLSITFVASWWGAGSAISSADLAFNEGVGAFCYYGLPVLFSTGLMILFSKFIRRVGCYTQSEMMEKRYTPLVAKLLSVFIVIFMIFNAASQMVGIGDFFGNYLGLDYKLAILMGTSIVLIYSMFGGFRGVVLTDIIQFVLLLLSAVILLVIVLTHNDMNQLMEAAKTLRPSSFLDLSKGFSKYWVYIITFGCAWMIQANIWQRISATKSDKEAFKMTSISFFIFIPLYLIVVLIGMGAITMFKTLPSGGVVSGLVLKYASPVIGAIVFVGLSAAIMSTMDSLLNTASMTITMDLVGNSISSKHQLSLSRIATLVVTLISMAMAIHMPSILELSWISSDLISTGIFIPLIFGFIFKWGNSYGAISTMLWGMGYCSYNFLITSGISLPHFYKIQSTEQVLFGMGISLVIYIVMSLCTHRASEVQKAEAFIAEAIDQK